MTHEEQIKWMADRIAHLEHCQESAMGMVATLMGKLKPQREWVGLTDKEIQKALNVTPESSNWNMIMVLEWAKKIETALLEKNS